MYSKQHNNFNSVMGSTRLVTNALPPKSEHITTLK